MANMVESKLVQLNFENNSYIVNIYVFSMLNFGHILISDFVVADLFMHSLSGMILLCLATSFLHRKCFWMRYIFHVMTQSPNLSL